MYQNTFKTLDRPRYSTSGTEAYSRMTKTPSSKSLKQQQSYKYKLSEDIHQPKPSIATTFQQQLLKRQNDLLKIQLQHLKEENVVLKRQIQKYIKKPPLPHYKTKEKVNRTQKQVSLYQDIIEKLQTRIKILLKQNQDLKSLNQTFQKKLQKVQEVELILKQIHRIQDLSNSLQSDIRKDDNEWLLYKQIWLAQKQYYKEIISKLEFEVNCLKSK